MVKAPIRGKTKAATIVALGMFVSPAVSFAEAPAGAATRGASQRNYLPTPAYTEYESGVCNSTASLCFDAIGNPSTDYVSRFEMNGLLQGDNSVRATLRWLQYEIPYVIWTTGATKALNHHSPSAWYWSQTKTVDENYWSASVFYLSGSQKIGSHWVPYNATYYWTPFG